VGDLVRGRVSRVTTFGAFVQLADGIEGLCHISEIDEKRGKGDKPQMSGPGSGARQSGLLDPGRDYEFKIGKNQHGHALKSGSAIAPPQKQAERREMDDYRSTKSKATATIGDAIMAKRSL